MDQICRLKRVEEEVKDQYHTMAKYKKKIKMLTKERESLKKTLQKRNQTIINLNKENSKLKEQVMSLQTLESVRYNSDDNITEYTDYQNDTEDNNDIMHRPNISATNSILGSTTNNRISSNISPAMHQKTYYKHPGYNPMSHSSSTDSTNNRSHGLYILSTNNNNKFKHFNPDSISDDNKSITTQTVDENNNTKNFGHQKDESQSLDPEEIKRLEAELNLSKQNNENWQNTVKQLQNLADKQNGKDEVSTPATVSTIAKEASPQPKNTDAMNELIQTLNATSLQQQQEQQQQEEQQKQQEPQQEEQQPMITPGGDDINIYDDSRIHKPSEPILKLVQEKQALLQQHESMTIKDPILNTALNINTLSDTNIKNDSILSDIQSQWMEAETEKLQFSLLYTFNE